MKSLLTILKTLFIGGKEPPSHLPFNAIDVADALLYQSARKGELLTSQKLNKILFYEQAYYLAEFNKPLFNEEIEDWFYGPVVPVVYEQLKDVQGKIQPRKRTNLIFNSKQQEDLFYEVFNQYRKFSESALIFMSKTDLNNLQDERPNKDMLINAVKKYL